MFGFGGKKDKTDKADKAVPVKKVEGFKCPYCFRGIHPEEVAFRAMTSYKKQDLDSLPDYEQERKKLYQEKADSIFEAFWNRYPGSRPEDNVNGRWVSRTFEKHAALAQYNTSCLTNASFDALGPHLEFKRDEDGFLNEVIDTEGTSSKVRICPHCHNRLPFEFGKYPIKFISVVGITSSGKTVYLSQVLGKIEEMLIGAGITVAGECPELAEFVKNHRILQGIDLPIGNTKDRLTLPMPVNIKNQKGERATLVFYDIAGENCVDSNQMEKYGAFIRNADGIIMIMDPRQFTDLVYLDSGDGKSEEDAYSPNKVISSMYSAFVSSDFSGGVCDTPLAAAISKSDLLKRAGVMEEYSNVFRDIPYENYKPGGFPYEDWRNLDSEIRILMDKKPMGKLLENSLKEFFPNHGYFAFSALNGMPIISEEGRYQMEVNPVTVRVEEPLLWILNKLGIIDRAEKKVKKR